MCSSDLWSFWLLDLDLTLDVDLTDLGFIGPYGVISVLSLVAWGIIGSYKNK